MSFTIEEMDEEKEIVEERVIDIIIEDEYSEPKKVKCEVTERWRNPFKYTSREDVIDTDFLDENQPDKRVVCVDVDGRAKYMVKLPNGCLQDLDDYMDNSAKTLSAINASIIERAAQGAHLGGVRG